MPRNIKKMKNGNFYMMEDPFCYPKAYEKLIGELTGLYSRRINREQQIFMRLMKIKKIHILRMWTHYGKLQ